MFANVGPKGGPLSTSVLITMLNSAGSAPTNATQTKERLYAQLAMSLGRTARAISQTADLCEQLQVDLHAMRIFAGLDAAKYVSFPMKYNTGLNFL